MMAIASPSSPRCRTGMQKWCALILLAGWNGGAAQTPGDLDSDGAFTVRDLARLQGHITGAQPLGAAVAPLADVARDGAVNAADSQALVELILGTRTPEALPLAAVQAASPADGETAVAVTRETIIHFTIPLNAAASLDTTKFWAEFGGRKILSRVELASDRRKATLFHLEPLPSNARVQVTLDGAGLTDILGRAFDADGDGAAGGVFAMTFDTLSITSVPGTGMTGRVLASERATGGAEVPLAGVTITVDGAEETMRTTTAADGTFTLTPCPAGEFFVHIDGRTSPQSQWPDGDYYPPVGKKWFALAGKPDNPAGDAGEVPAGGAGTIYLPCICDGTLQTVSPVADTVIEFPPSVLAANPALAGTVITVPANSLFADDGTRGGMAGIAPVAPDRLPSPLPPGLALPLVITVQSDGATNFDRPVPLCLPNLPDPVSGQKLPPGAASALWSFNHDTGDWEVVGPMTVTPDGNFVKSDAGTGIRQPGWHGATPGSQASARLAGVDCPPLSPDVQGQNERLVRAQQKSEAAAQKLFNSLAGIASKLGELEKNTGGGVFTLLSYVSFYKSAEKCLVQGDEAACLSVALKIAAVLASGTVFGTPIFIATVVHNAIGVLTASDEAGAAIADLQYEVEDCLNARADLAPAERTRLRQQTSAAAQEFAGHRAEAHWELTQQKPDFDALAGIATEVAPLADRYLANASAANPRGGLNDAEWAFYWQRQATAAGHIVSIGGRKRLPDLLIRVFDSYDRYRRRVEPVYFPPAAPPPGVVPRPPPPPPGPAFLLLERQGFEQRLKFAPGGRLSLRVGPQEGYRIHVYEPANNRTGTQFFIAPENGRLVNLPRVPLVTDNGPDTDNDGLSDDAEHIIGTIPTNPDTDGDGVRDGAEVQQGSDPASGLPVRTGVLASVPLRGSTEDVCAVNDIAVTANGAAGIGVVNVSSGVNPVRLAELDTPGSAVAVACFGNLVAVADHSAGLAIVDISDPRNVRLVRRVPVGDSATSVTAAGPTAYVGTTGGNVTAVDMLTGALLQRTFSPGGQIHDMTVAGETLYILQTGKVSALRLDVPVLAVSGSAAAPGATGAGGRRLRIFAGGGSLYSTWRGGWNIFDVAANPNAPVHVQQVITSQQGWKHIVANGSGLGLAAVGINSTNDGPHHVDLYDVGANGRGSTYLTTIESPGLAAAVASYNGFAFVADSSRGLTVINYRAFDTLGQPPAVTLSGNFALPSGPVGEGALTRLSATASDDVQVRNVEFYVDGALAVTDGSYPFEHRFIAPLITPEKTNIVVRAKATDTGGNVAWTPPYTLALVPDAVPPQVLAFSPPHAALAAPAAQVLAVFSENMDTATLAAGGLTLTSAGPDNVIGNGDDVPVSGGTLSFREQSNTAFLTFPDVLAPGSYRLRAASPAADLAGNIIAAPAQADFRIYSNVDADEDGLPDDWEPMLGTATGDNDSDNDGTLDGMEDFDGDGLTNMLEFALGRDPRLADSDGDGIADGAEDFDMDGVSDGLESTRGTNPLAIDTDGDGLDDLTEAAQGTNPLDSTTTVQMRLATPRTAYINALPEAPPASVSVSAAAARASFLNALPDAPPASVSVSAAARPATYLNALSDAPPATVSVSAASDVVSYENETP